MRRKFQYNETTINLMYYYHYCVMLSLRFNLHKMLIQPISQEFLCFISLSMMQHGPYPERKREELSKRQKERERETRDERGGSNGGMECGKWRESVGVGKRDGASSNGDRRREVATERRLLAPPHQPLVLSRSPFQSPALEGPFPLSLSQVLFSLIENHFFVIHAIHFRCLICARWDQLAPVCLLPSHLYFL